VFYFRLTKQLSAIRSRNLASTPSQLVVAVIAFVAASCEAAKLPNDPLSSRPTVIEALISHLVFLAPRYAIKSMVASVPGSQQ